jgi:hypothetical protein
MTTDVERLHQWLSQHDLSLYGLALELGLLYNSVWSMAQRNNNVSDRFVLHFIRRYGYDEARTIFQDCLVPIPPRTSV